MKWAGHVERMGRDKTYVKNFVWRTWQGRDILEDIDLNRGMILTFILGKRTVECGMARLVSC
jgi:hypothetical protein